MSNHTSSAPIKQRSLGRLALYYTILVLVILLLVEVIISVVLYHKNSHESLAMIEAARYIKNDMAGSHRRYIRLNERMISQNRYYDATQFKDANLPQKEYLFRVDDNGFVEPSKVHDQPDLTVVFMGGSVVECQYVSEEKRFPYLVGRQLEAALNKRVNAYNAGCSGAHSMHSNNTLLNKIIPLRPEYVLLCHNINDMNTLVYESGYWNDNPNRSLIIDPNKPNFSNNRRTDEWAHIRGNKIDIKQAEIIGHFENSLTQFIATCRNYHITPVLMTQTSRITQKDGTSIASSLTKRWVELGIEFSTIQSVYMALNDATRKVAKENQVALIDLDQLIPGNEANLYDVVHFHDTGSERAASIITQHLLTLLSQPEHIPTINGETEGKQEGEQQE